MKQAFAAALTLAAASTAQADGLIQNVGGKVFPTAALAESTCTLEVELRGGVAIVDQHQRFVNNDANNAVGLRYESPLPEGAQITGLEVDGQKSIAVGTFRSTRAPAGSQMPIDPALIERTDDGYALTLQPLVAHAVVDVTIHYVAPVEIRHGSLLLSLPARLDPNVPSCHGTLRATPGPGAKLAKFTVNGRDATRDKAKRPQFDVDAKDVHLAAELSFTGTQPLVWTQSQPLSSGTASLVTVLAPPLKTASLNRRTLFVVDGSRSMELVGKERVRKVINAVGNALPVLSTVDGIVYDRTAKRINTELARVSVERIATLENAIMAHVPTNGSDLVAALKMAHTVLDTDTRESTLVVLISDGVGGEIKAQQMVEALGFTAANVDVLSVLIDPAKTTAPHSEELSVMVGLLGGAAVEVSTDHLDVALAEIDGWLRPSFTHVDVHGLPADIPKTLLSGDGFTRATIHKTPLAVSLTAMAGTEKKVTARAMPTAPVAALVLADANTVDKKAPYLTTQTSFAVLGTQGDLSKHRMAVIAGGMPYERIVAQDDLDHDAPATRAASATGAQAAPSAIAQISLQMLFRNQLNPKAIGCYQKALGVNTKLAGTVDFTFTLGRGEISAVEMTGLGDPQFDACMLDAAYELSIPFPDFAVNADDQTIAHYPIRFAISDARKPLVINGDADSASPIDIDAIKPGLPDSARRRALEMTKKDLETPLGTLGTKPKK